MFYCFYLLLWIGESDAFLYLDLEMGRIRIQLSNPDPDPPDFRIEEFDPDPHRGSTQGGLGSIRFDPDLHKSAKTFLFWLVKMMTYLNKIL